MTGRCYAVLQESQGGILQPYTTALFDVGLLGGCGGLMSGDDVVENNVMISITDDWLVEQPTSVLRLLSIS